MKRSTKNGVCPVDAATGEIIWGFEGKTTSQEGQGVGFETKGRRASGIPSREG